MVVLTLLALAIFGGAHFLVHGLARHFSARAFGVRGTKLVLAIGDREAFAASPPLRRALAASTGPAANYLLCALCFFAAEIVGGQPVTTLAVRVHQGYPAAEAGMRDGDRIVSLDGKPVTDFAEVGAAVRARGSGTIVVGVDRAGTALDFPVAIRGGRLGIESVLEQRPAQVGHAAVEAVQTPARSMYRMYTQGVRQLVVGSEPAFRGPVGITRAVRDAGGPGQAALLLVLLAMLGSYAWPASILVAVFANRTWRRAG